MWRSKKVIVGVILAAVLLFGSLGGVALADDPENEIHPRAEFLERLAGKLGITVEELQAKIAEVRGELPERDCEMWQGKRGPAGHFGNLGERFGIEIDEDAWKAAMADARERIQAGEDRQEVMAEVMEGFGIDIEELKAKFAENADGERPFKRGFMDPRGMGGMRSFCGPAPTE
ncbi:hypothetical protein ACFLUO_02170 [Chloroflexota bacterium]